MAQSSLEVGISDDRRLMAVVFLKQIREFSYYQDLRQKIENSL